MKLLREKIEKMKLGATCFIKNKKLGNNYILAAGSVTHDGLEWFELSI